MMSLIQNAAGVFVAVARDVSTFEQIVVIKCLGRNEVNKIITHKPEEAKLKSNSVRSVRFTVFLTPPCEMELYYFNDAYVVVEEYTVKTKPLLCCRKFAHDDALVPWYHTLSRYHTRGTIRSCTVHTYTGNKILTHASEGEILSATTLEGWKSSVMRRLTDYR